MRSNRLAVATVIFALVGACGCAFRVSDDSDALKECKTDEDCAEFRICNPVSSTCDLEPPDFQSLQLQGPFDLDIQPDGTGASMGGLSLAASWPKLSQNGYTLPAAEIRIADLVYLDMKKTLFLTFEGVRHEDSLLGDIGFYKVRLAPSSASSLDGGQHTTSATGFLFLCPTYPKRADGTEVPNDPFWEFTSTQNCLVLFAMDSMVTTITIRTSSHLSGYLSAPLTPVFGLGLGGSQ